MAIALTATSVKHLLKAIDEGDPDPDSGKHEMKNV